MTSSRSRPVLARSAALVALAGSAVGLAGPAAAAAPTGPPDAPRASVGPAPARVAATGPLAPAGRLAGAAQLAPAARPAPTAALAPAALEDPTEPGRVGPLLDRPTPAGPPAQLAWVRDRNVRVSAPGVRARTVARLRGPARGEVDLSLSRDGRFLVVLDGTTTVLLPIAGGGRPIAVADALGSGEGGVRWAPDGNQVLLVDDTIVRCALEPTVVCGPTDVPRAAAEFGASWSPDSTQFAYIRARSSRATPRTELGDLVTVDAQSGRTTVVQRAQLSRRRWVYPTPPVWTRVGLAFTVYATRVNRKGDTSAPYRVRTRLVGPDGRIRTINASAPRRNSVTFLASSDSPSGALLGLSARLHGEPVSEVGRLTFGVRTLGTDGALRPYGVEYTSDDRRQYEQLGVLADGRVVLVGSLIDFGGEPTLHLMAPGAKDPGRPVAGGDAVSAAVAYPNDALGF